jgi:hypothetical protein
MPSTENRRSFDPSAHFLMHLEAARSGARVLNDKVRGLISVYELEPSLSDPGPRTLVFESSESYWRTAAYPAEWRGLPDDQLLNLSRGGL